MTTTINVGIMGFSPYEESKFQKIFEISSQHQRAYNLADVSDSQPVELLIVKEANDLALNQQQAYQLRYKNSRIPVVVAGRELAANAEAYYIRGVLIPSRVLAVLDQVKIPIAGNEQQNQAEEYFAVEDNPSAEIISAETETQADALQVLVVDDSEMMQKAVQLELNQATIPVATEFANTGESALEKVKLKKYDFIFLDVMMPGIDGFETCSQIRLLEGMEKTPIIMLTSKTSAMDEVKGLMAGCTTYLTKPFEHDEFHKMLERIVHWVKEFNESK